MTPFNNELQVGQPAMIINVEYSSNSHLIGTTIIVDSLLSPEEANETVFGSNGYAYASYNDRDGVEHFIRQKYLMPIPPLGDVYADEINDVLENLKSTCP